MVSLFVTLSGFLLLLSLLSDASFCQIPLEINSKEHVERMVRNAREVVYQ